MPRDLLTDTYLNLRERFLGFQSKPSGHDGTVSVILVYIEGYTNINELKKNFNTR